jgi:hypothetical protein
MLPLADAENVDPQMPSERFSWRGAREFDEKSSLPFQRESKGPKTARNSRRIRRNRQSKKMLPYKRLSVAVLAVFSELLSIGQIP